MVYHLSSTQITREIIYFYDIEVFPNFFSVLLISEDMMDEYIFYVYDDRNDIAALIQFVTQPNLLLVGYNNSGYDDIILKWIIQHPDCSNEDIFKVSKTIIETRNRKDLPDNLKEIMYNDTPWKSADLMALLRMNMNVPSLKHCAIHLEHGKLQDLPKSPTDYVEPEELPTILSYNRNDVIITGRLWHVQDIQEAVIMRRILGEQYGVNLLSADDSRIANIILQHEYGTPERKGSPRKVIRGRELIPPTLKFQTPEMQEVLTAIERLILIEVETPKGTHTHLTPKRKRFEHVFNFDGTTYKMAKGGLHSDDKPRILRSNQEIVYKDADVASYYPNLRQVYSLVPGHLDRDRFLEVDRKLIEQRLAAKASGNKATADGLKITINGIFGKYNYEYFWLYDPLCFYRTTIYGQLFLLMLIEMLHLQGIRTVSANTDGIVCEVPKSKEDTYFQVCREWEQQTGMSLEYTDYEFLVQLNVNSYMSRAVKKTSRLDDGTLKIKPADEIKVKKDFLSNKESGLKKQAFIKGYYAPVIAMALQAYYKDGTPIETTIRNHENIHDFLFTQRAAGKFELIVQDSNGREEHLQKTNRFYITDRGTVLIKRDKTQHVVEVAGIKVKSRKGGKSSIGRGQYIHILNNVSKDRPPINREYYVRKTKEIIDKIEPPVTMSVLDFI